MPAPAAMVNVKMVNVALQEEDGSGIEQSFATEEAYEMLKQARNLCVAGVLFTFLRAAAGGVTIKQG